VQLGRSQVAAHANQTRSHVTQVTQVAQVTAHSPVPKH
jgi:hypothetical protein